MLACIESYACFFQQRPAARAPPCLRVCRSARARRSFRLRWFRRKQQPEEQAPEPAAAPPAPTDVTPEAPAETAGADTTTAPRPKRRRGSRGGRGRKKPAGTTAKAEAKEESAPKSAAKALRMIARPGEAVPLPAMQNGRAGKAGTTSMIGIASDALVPAAGPRSRGARVHPRSHQGGPALAASECGLWLGARDPEARRHHRQGYHKLQNGVCD